MVPRATDALVFARPIHEMNMTRIKAYGRAEASEPFQENLAVHGENLRFSTHAATQLRGRFKLIYVDPPYNTGNRFEHYDDARPTEEWHAFMEERLRTWRELLAPNGLIVCQIDDEEQAYLQLIMDRVFGRANRLNTVVVKMSELSGVKMTHAGPRLPKLKEYLLIYGRSDASELIPLRVPKAPEKLESYRRYYTKIVRNVDAPVEAWEIVSIRKYLKEQGRKPTKDAIRELQFAEAHRVVYRTNNKFLSTLDFDQPIKRVESTTGKEYIWWEGKEMLFLEDHCFEALGDLWTDISTINLNKEGAGNFRNGKKPERLMERILELTTEAGEWVFDPFGGSGTTAAVAHKLGRRWLTTEEGEQYTSHLVPRLRAITEGEPLGGIDIQPGADRGRGFVSATWEPVG
jgi:adenine-specific DNA-methyltransferase